MNSQPIEILESIISTIPTNDLFNKCLVDRTWYKLVRSELYRRWKKCAIDYGDLFRKHQIVTSEWVEEFDPDISSELYEQSQLTFTNLQNKKHEQLDIEKYMYDHGMIVDESEKNTVLYDITIGRYKFDPWGLDWEIDEPPLSNIYSWEDIAQMSANDVYDYDWE